MRRQRLIEARKASGFTQEQIAERAGVERSTIGKWERGDSTPHPHQRAAFAEALDITMDELDGMLSSIPAGPNDAAEWLVSYLSMEQSATDLRAHEPRAIYGLFQAPAYVEALVGRVGVSGVSDTYLQRSIEQRLHRQQRVRDGDLSVHVIQPEAALHLQVGDATVMAEQLDTLAELADLPNVTLQVTQFAEGQYEARRLGDFVIMSHPWGKPRVHLEGYGGGQFITDHDEVSYFDTAFKQAASKVALSTSETKSFVRELAEQHRSA